MMLDKARTDCADLQRELNSAKSSSNSAQERELMELKNRNEYLQKSLDDKVFDFFQICWSLQSPVKQLKTIIDVYVRPQLA